MDLCSLFGSFVQDDLDLLSVLLNQAAVALENTRLYQELEQRVNDRTAQFHQVNLSLEQRISDLNTINHISRAIASELELEALIQLVGEQVRQAFNSEIVNIGVQEPQTGELTYRYTFSSDHPVDRPGVNLLDEQVLQHGVPLLVNQEPKAQRKKNRTSSRERKYQTYLGAPLSLGKHPIGVISTQRLHTPQGYTDQDLHVLTTIATHVSAAIQNAQLFSQAESQRSEIEAYNRQLESRVREQVEQIREGFDRLSRALEGTIIALSSTLERRDPYTAGHQQRVSQLACAIAGQLQLPESQIDSIRVAGILHDIGKIGIPAEILNKPGRLSEVEFNLIKIHAQVGYDILRSIEFPWPIAQIVLQHHEKMDGSGYPFSLKGEQILPEARTLCVADVVEAMSSHRPYRPALGFDRALDEITRQRGIAYDALVVDACTALFHGQQPVFSFAA